MSSLPFEFLLALRYLRPKRTFVSIITLISVLGVTLGVAVLIIVIAVMSGFDKEMKDKLFGFNSHITVIQTDPLTGQAVPMSHYADVTKLIKANPSVTGSTPVVVWQVMMETEPDKGRAQICAPIVRGISPNTQVNLGLVKSNVVSGAFDLSGHGILVGLDIAQEKNLTPGDRVAISSPQDIQKWRESKQDGKEEIIPPTDYEVRGIFDTGFFEFNSTIVVVSLENAQEIAGLGNDVHGLQVMLKDPFQCQGVARQLKKMLGTNYSVRTWQQDSTQMMAVLVEKNVMYYILFFIVIVAAFGITCTLITFVVLKTREIGILKALGATSQQVMWIFLSQSMVVSVLGVLTGTGLGMLALAYRNGFLHLMRNITGWELFPASVYMFTELPAQIIPSDVLIICGGSFVICQLAAAFPVWNASRLKPVEALRHD